MSLHKNLPASELHTVPSLEYVDAAARNGATGLISTDIGRMARQLDDNSFWMLQGVGPVVWVGATAPGLASSPPVDVTKAAAAAGVATTVSRSDHKHNVTTAAASTIGTSNSEGSATTLARSDHGHDHGAQSSGTLHAAVIAAGASGFMTGSDKTKLDGIASGATNTPLTSSAPADVTKATAAVGSATAAARADHKHDISTSTPSSIGTANNEGISTALARADHEHDHGSQTDGTLHAAALHAGASGFMTGADKTLLDSLDLAQIVTVAQTGGDFSSVAAAIASITDAAITKPYLIRVAPGDYIEPPFSMKQWVTVRGVGGLYNVHLITNNNSAHFITGVDACELSNVAVTGPTGVGYAAIDYQTASNIPFILDHVVIRVGYYGVWSHPATRGTVHCLFVVNQYGGSQINKLFHATAYGGIILLNSGFMSGPSNSVVHGFDAQGPNAELTMDVCFFRNGGSTVGIYADNGATIRGSAVTIARAGIGVQIASAGTTTEIALAGVVIAASNVTTHVQTDTPTCLISISGVAEISKFNLAAGTPIAATFADAALGNVVLGELWLGTVGEQFPLGSYMRQNASSGVYSGGGVARGSGLHAAVSAGAGFTAVAGVITQVTWGAVSLLLTASTTNYIVFDAAGTISAIVGEPDYTSQSILAVATTDATSITHLQTELVVLHDHVASAHIYFEDVIGPISVTGCVTTKHTTPSLQLDVDGGSFYIADNEWTASASAPITFTYWHKNGSGGWTPTVSQTAINATQYDDGTGTLATMGAGTYRRDTVFVSVNGGGTEYHVVFGQQTFATSIDAILNPVPPDFLGLYSMRTAAVVVLKSATDLTSVIDQRPKLGQLSSGSTSITRHADLSGLSANDHTQYQLRSEKGTSGGYCGLTGTLVAAANLPFTATPPVNVDAAASATGTATEIARQDHKHSIATGTPVAIGTANAAGTATSLARSDHVHAGLVGGDFAHAESEGVSTTTSGTYQTKLSFATGALTGTYRVGVSFELTIGSNNNITAGRLYNVTDATELLVEEHYGRAGFYLAASGHVYLTLAGASKTLEIQYRNPGGGVSMSIRRARIEFWKVS